MSVFEILDTLLLRPLQLLFEVIYMVADRIIGNPGLSIIVLSLVMNFLVLPLYLRADAMQEEEKQTEMRLRKGVSHIKKTFKGDEAISRLMFSEGRSPCSWRSRSLSQPIASFQD